MGTELLSRSIFIDPPSQHHMLWAIDTALRSSAVAVVVAPLRCSNFILSRRSAIAARHGGTIGCFIGSISDHPVISAAASRWSVRPIPSESQQPRFELELVKYKGAPPAQTRWIIEPEYDGQCNEVLPLSLPAKSDELRRAS